MTTNFWQGLWHGKPPAGDLHNPSRLVVRPTGGIIRGKFPSRKNGRMVQYEGLLELDAIYLFETNPLILRYREQPPQVFYPDGARIRRYTPDFELHLGRGDLISVEVKPKRMLNNEEIQHKFKCISDFYNRNATSFVLLHDEILRQEPRLTNLKWIHHQSKATHPNIESALYSVRLHKSSLPMTLQNCISRFADRNICVYNLLLAGLLRCTLDEPISLDTLLDFPEVDHGWFYLAQEYNF